ncbi:hypothetical protein AMOR_27530 [Anaeromyxobacter oryzae]|uniref:Uncharacterized protein n=1 Tax=Anaeromyxobacter oryzae TaxID=2918170 RepID=A0ABN6MV76_9BACT|nr:hypothetical protein AMOR_27530 [Anaeromyxobacter oryzae]
MTPTRLFGMYRTVFESQKSTANSATPTTDAMTLKLSRMSIIGLPLSWERVDGAEHWAGRGRRKAQPENRSGDGRDRMGRVRRRRVGRARSAERAC